MIPEENLNLPVFRNCTWSWHHLNREVGAATPWIRGPLAHAVRDAHFAHLPPVPILGAVHARDLDLGSGKLLPTAAWPKGNMGAARGLHPRDVTGLSNPCAIWLRSERSDSPWLRLASFLPTPILGLVWRDHDSNSADSHFRVDPSLVGLWGS